MTTCKSGKVGAQFDYQHARIHLYSRHVALSGSGTWDYVSLRWLMTLPIYKKTTMLIVSGCISQHQGICQRIFLLLQYFACYHSVLATHTY